MKGKNIPNPTPIYIGDLLVCKNLLKQLVIGYCYKIDGYGFYFKWIHSTKTWHYNEKDCFSFRSLSVLSAWCPRLFRNNNFIKPQWY